VRSCVRAFVRSCVRAFVRSWWCGVRSFASVTYLCLSLLPSALLARKRLATTTFRLPVACLSCCLGSSPRCLVALSCFSFLLASSLARWLPRWLPCELLSSCELPSILPSLHPCSLARALARALAHYLASLLASLHARLLARFLARFLAPPFLTPPFLTAVATADTAMVPRPGDLSCAGTELAVSQTLPDSR